MGRVCVLVRWQASITDVNALFVNLRVVNGGCAKQRRYLRIANFDCAAEENLYGNETVLLVEDEDAVRLLASIVLQSYQYQVLPASNGIEAVQNTETHQGQIDLLLTDVVMPGMSGRELADILRPRFPQMKMLFASGYTNDAVVRHGLSDQNVAFLQKPYDPTTLVGKVRQVLDEK